MNNYHYFELRGRTETTNLAVTCLTGFRNGSKTNSKSPSPAVKAEANIHSRLLSNIEGLGQRSRNSNED
jgi:hypothetical protein